MILILDIDFNTDGDFTFDNLESIFNENSNLYRNAKIAYRVEEANESIEFGLAAEGDHNACRWAARDLLESLICELRACKSYLVGDLYRFLNTPLDIVQKRGNEVRYKDSLSGNYEGTRLWLQILD